MQCSAQSYRNQKQCNRRAIAGATVCWVHGGAAPQVRAAAHRRLLALVDPALEILGASLASKSESTRMQAARDILDRAGHKATDKVELSGSVTSIAETLRSRRAVIAAKAIENKDTSK